LSQLSHLRGPFILSDSPKSGFFPRVGHFVGRGGRMTTWWRPDLERIRAEIAAEAELELEVKVEASDGDGEKQGTKRKRAPPTKGAVRARGEATLEVQGVRCLSARPSAL